MSTKNPDAFHDAPAHICGNPNEACDISCMPTEPDDDFAAEVEEYADAGRESTHCPRHNRKWYRCCDPESNMEMHNRPDGSRPAKPKCEGETEYGHGLTRTVVHGACCGKPAQPSEVERAREAIRFWRGEQSARARVQIDTLIAAERADAVAAKALALEQTKEALRLTEIRADAAERAVSGMHAAGCGCHSECGYDQPDCSHTDPRCIAARKEATDGK